MLFSFTSTHNWSHTAATFQSQNVFLWPHYYAFSCCEICPANSFISCVYYFLGKSLKKQTWEGPITLKSCLKPWTFSNVTFSASLQILSSVQMLWMSCVLEISYLRHFPSSPIKYPGYGQKQWKHVTLLTLQTLLFSRPICDNPVPLSHFVTLPEIRECTKVASRWCHKCTKKTFTTF